MGAQSCRFIERVYSTWGYIGWGLAAFRWIVYWFGMREE